MKKHLIAAAVAAAVVAPAAMAQVTVYGLIDTSITSTNNVGDPTTGAGTVTSVNSSLLYTNRLGFRGEEDLGGGLKAGFVVESSFLSDEESTFSIGNRGAEVFLTGGFGQVRIGKSASSDANVVASGPTNLTNFAAGTATRPDNRVQYISPAFSGFTFNLAYATDSADAENETLATKTNNRYGNLGLNYSAGPLRVLVFQASADIETAAVVSPAAAAQDGDVKDTGLLASYDFGVAAAQVRYLRTKTSDAVNTAIDRKTIALDVTAPLGNGMKLGLGYIDINNDAADTDSKKYSVYLQKDLSKRTALYAAYATVSNDSKAKIGATGNTTDRQPVVGENQNTFGVGIRHSF